MNIPPYLGLEVEVGEIKGPGELTTVEEAIFFIGGLNAWCIFPDYLAISNGSKNGTYDRVAGKVEGIRRGLFGVGPCECRVRRKGMGWRHATPACCVARPSVR